MIVNFDEIDVLNTDPGGGNVCFYKDQLFTGTIVEYNANGILIGEINVLNGSTKGRVAAYYDNGQIMEEYYESYNRLYGIYKEWDEEGNLISETDCDAEYQPQTDHPYGGFD